MKTEKLNGMWSPLRAGLLFIALLVAGETALAAGTAANAILRNTVTVNYENIANQPQTAEVAFVDITVTLIETAPIVGYSRSVPTSLSNISEGQSVNLYFDITSNANGNDDYDLTISEVVSTPAQLTGFTYATIDVNVLALGATTVSEILAMSNTAGAGTNQCVAPGTDTCTINAPTDSSDNSDVNGIAGGDKLKVVGDATVYCDVVSVDDGTSATPYAPGSNESDIVVTNCKADIDGLIDLGASVALAVGDDVFETREVLVQLTDAGDLDTSPTETITVTATGESETDLGGTDSDTVVVTVVATSLKVRKFVRNASAAVTPAAIPATAGAVLNLDGTLFYAAGVTADPGQILEYAIVIINTGAVDVQDVSATDDVVPFTRYVAFDSTTAGAKGLNLYPVEDLTNDDCTTTTNTCFVTTPVTAATANASSTLSTASDHGGITGGTADVNNNYSGGTLNIYAGTGPDENATAGDEGGNIAAGKISIVTYRLIVEP